MSIKESTVSTTCRPDLTVDVLVTKARKAVEFEPTFAGREYAKGHLDALTDVQRMQADLSLGAQALRERVAAYVICCAHDIGLLDDPRCPADITLDFLEGRRDGALVALTAITGGYDIVRAIRARDAMLADPEFVLTDLLRWFGIERLAA